MYPSGTGSDLFHHHAHGGHNHHNDSMMSTSPTSPGHTSLSGSSPFLPGYLLGDHQLHQHTVSSPKLWSTGGSSHSPSHRSASSHLSQTSVPSLGSTFIRDSTRAKLGAPPVKSLYSSPTSPEVNTPQGGFHNQNRTHSSPALRQMSVSSPAPPTTGLVFHTPGGSRGDTSLAALKQNQNLPTSPAQTDPFYTQGDLKSDDVLDETWVTVFGFPPGATSFILQQFSQYGTILKHVVVSECNWMHIHYQSKIQAKKALSKDGKVYGGCMKIGVTPCIEKTVMDGKENQQLMDSMLHSTTDLNTSTLTPIRPLTAAYVASRGEYEIVQDKQTPKRDTGIVSKLKEYMFGY